MTFDAQLQAYRSRCETALDACVKGLFQPGSTVSQAAEYSLMQGGKRVRGTLVLAVCDLLHGRPGDASPLAAAMEMVHAFSLVHDDLPCMDDDDMRRGKPAAHIAFGEATALLAGDLLALEAFGAIAGAPLPAQMQAAAVRVLAAAAGARGMIYGQELDLYHEKTAPGKSELLRVHRHKTGALFRASVQLGVVAAGFAPEEHEELAAYADSIGLVFQITDDILDVTSSAEALGKPIGSDKQQGKTTFVSMFGMEESRQEAQRLTAEATGGLRHRFGGEAGFLCTFANRLLARIH